MGSLTLTSDKLLVILSDIEMGAGGRVDDFPQSDFLGQLIETYGQPPHDEMAVDLIFNGDTFDLLKTSYVDRFPRHVTRDVALAKMVRISAAHPKFFEAVRKFVAHGKAPRRVFFIDGNHDAELRFPEIQDFIRGLCGGSEHISFPGYEMRIGRVHIEHGQQQDPMFQMDPDRPFISYDGSQILNLSWGAAALLDTAIPLQDLFCFHDRLKPKQRVFELMPEVREYLVGIFWQYWTRDYWKDFFSLRDPTKKLRWTMLKEVLWRLGSKDVEIEADHTFDQALMRDDGTDLFVLGHLHQPQWTSFGSRKLLRAGCLRNEYMIRGDGEAIEPIAKNYVEVYMRGDVPSSTRMIEFEAPAPPVGYIPDSIFDVLPEVRRRLEEARAAKESKGADKAREAQEAKELAEKDADD